MRTPSASRPVHRFTRYLPLLGAVALLAACSRPEPPQEPVRSVKLMTVGLGALQSQLEYAGEVRARVESRLGFRVPGRIASRNVDVGAEVGPGDLLATLDPTDQQNQLRAAMLGCGQQRLQVGVAVDNPGARRLEGRHAGQRRLFAFGLLSGHGPHIANPVGMGFL